MAEDPAAPRDLHEMLVEAAQSAMREIAASPQPLPPFQREPPQEFDVFSETARELMRELRAEPVRVVIVREVPRSLPAAAAPAASAVSLLREPSHFAVAAGEPLPAISLVREPSHFAVSQRRSARNLSSSVAAALAQPYSALTLGGSR